MSSSKGENVRIFAIDCTGCWRNATVRRPNTDPSVLRVVYLVTDPATDIELTVENDIVEMVGQQA